MIAFLVTLFIACNDSTSTSNSSNSSTPANTTVEATSTEIENAVADASQKVGESTPEIVEAGTAAATDVSDKAAATAEKIVSEPMKEKVESRAGKSRDDRPKTTIPDKVKEKAEVVKEKVNTAVKEANDKADATRPPVQEIKETVKNTTTSTTRPPTTPPVKTETPKADPKPEPPKEEPVKPTFSHDSWDKLLRKHVSSSGKVNYKSFKSDKIALESYIKLLQDNPLQDSWNKNKKMAYWINAYNAFTIKLIVDNYPISSITKLDGGKPWDKKWIKLGGKTYSLNNIENDILRPQYKDARIHFAVNCAAKSCPTLLNRAWTASNLNANFEKQATAFINNANFNKISEKNIEVSKIFEWYAVDFGDLITYLNKYSRTKIKSNAKINYMEYDWNLNE